MTERVIPCAGLQYNHPDGLCQDTVLPPSRTARTFDAIAQLGFDVSFRSLPPPGNTIHNFLREHITPLGLEVITCFSAAKSLQLQWTQQCVPTSPLSVEPSDVPTLPLCTHPVLPIDLDPQEPTPAFDNGLSRSSPLGASDRRDRGFGETPKSMSQPSHARVPLSLANHLPLPSLAPAVDIGRDDNDITDLFLSWESTEPPSLVSLTPPAVVTPLLSTTTSAHFENVELYTDGSRGPSDGPNHTTWAFVVLEPTPNGLQLIDWYGDFISLDPLEPSWIGATHDAIRDGEGSALMAGGLWACQAPVMKSTAIFSDADSVLQAADGRYGLSNFDPLLVRLRALYTTSCKQDIEKGVFLLLRTSRPTAATLAMSLQILCCSADSPTTSTTTTITAILCCLDARMHP